MKRKEIQELVFDETIKELESYGNELSDVAKEDHRVLAALYDDCINDVLNDEPMTHVVTAEMGFGKTTSIRNLIKVMDNENVIRGLLISMHSYREIASFIYSMQKLGINTDNIGVITPAGKPQLDFEFDNGDTTPEDLLEQYYIDADDPKLKNVKFVFVSRAKILSNLAKINQINEDGTNGYHIHNGLVYYHVDSNHKRHVRTVIYDEDSLTRTGHAVAVWELYTACHSELAKGELRQIARDGYKYIKYNEWLNEVMDSCKQAVGEGATMSIKPLDYEWMPDDIPNVIREVNLLADGSSLKIHRTVALPNAGKDEEENQWFMYFTKRLPDVFGNVIILDASAYKRELVEVNPDINLIEMGVKTSYQNVHFDCSRVKGSKGSYRVKNKDHNNQVIDVAEKWLEQEGIDKSEVLCVCHKDKYIKKDGVKTIDFKNKLIDSGFAEGNILTHGAARGHNSFSDLRYVILFGVLRKPNDLLVKDLKAMARNVQHEPINLKDLSNQEAWRDSQQSIGRARLRRKVGGVALGTKVLVIDQSSVEMARYFQDTFFPDCTWSTFGSGTTSKEILFDVCEDLFNSNKGIKFSKSYIDQLVLEKYEQVHGTKFNTKLPKYRSYMNDACEEFGIEKNGRGRGTTYELPVQ